MNVEAITGTSSKRLAEVTRRLVAEFDAAPVVLFGSRAWGQPREDSDLDVRVVLDGSGERLASRMRARSGSGPNASRPLLETPRIQG